MTQLTKAVCTPSNDRTKRLTVQTGGTLGVWFYRIERPGPAFTYTSGWFASMQDAKSMAEMWHEAALPGASFPWTDLEPGEPGYDEISEQPDPHLNHG